MTKALIIVDVQNDFCEGGALAVAGGAEVAKKISDHLRDQHFDYDVIVASQDWHNPEPDKNGGHFAEDGEEPNYVETWPVHCVADTKGAELHDNLDWASLIDAYVRKGQGKPAYSAFEGTVPGMDPDEESSSLNYVLREFGEPDATYEVDVVGIATDYCVRATVLEAIKLGYKVRVLVNMIVGVAPDTSAAALTEMHDAGAILVEPSNG